MGISDKLTFQEVYQKQFDWQVINIIFKINNFNYLIQVIKYETTSQFSPYSLSHFEITDIFLPFHELKICEFCGHKANDDECVKLNKHMEEVFAKLKEHPSIRLLWLFEK